MILILEDNIMLERITNPKTKEPLFQIIVVDSRDLKPFTKICSKAEAEEMYARHTMEKDDDSWYVKKGREQVCRDGNYKSASLIVNHRGWGSDYMKMVIMEEAYISL